MKFQYYQLKPNVSLAAVIPEGAEITFENNIAVVDDVTFPITIEPMAGGYIVKEQDGSLTYIEGPTFEKRHETPPTAPDEIMFTNVEPEAPEAPALNDTQEALGLDFDVAKERIDALPDGDPKQAALKEWAEAKEAAIAAAATP